MKMKYPGEKEPKDDNREESDQRDDDDDQKDKDQNADAPKGNGKKGGPLMKKADEALTGDNLQKSLDKLDNFAQSEDSISRKEALLSKAAYGELSKSENEELFSILGGSDAPESSTDLTKSLTDNEPLQKSLDVSSYLQENHDALVKSLGAVGNAIEASDSRRHEFAMIQAKALVDIGSMVKSMSEVLESISTQPVGQPRSKGATGAAPLNKSFGGEPAEGERLNKSQVLDALDGLMEESMNKGANGRLSNGEDISVATAKFESGNQISPHTLAEVKRWRQENSATH